MNWKPSKTKGIPLYKQISSYLESKIVNGEFPAGSRLPSERELAEQLGVNRSTVNIAFDELKTTGLVNRIVGVGTIVSEDKWGQNFKRLPDWDRYVKEGYYPSNNLLNQKIYRSIRSNDSIINFAIGELSPDLSRTKLMTDIQTFEIDNYLGYEHVQGSYSLRAAISSYMENYRGIKATASSILVTSGAQQAIHLIIRCLLKPGDSIAIENPSYAYSLPIFHSEGLKTYYLPVKEDGIDPENIITLYKKHRIKMIFLNPIFHNPTGTTLSYEKRKKVLDICTKYGIAIIEDDPYSTIGFKHSHNYTLKSLDQEGAVLYISSLSKIISSGLRIGWIIGPQTVIERLTDAKQQMDFGQSIFPQSIAEKLLNSKHLNEHVHSLQTGLKEKRDLIVQSLEKELSGQVGFFVPDGGIHLWCKINEAVDEQLLFKESLKNGVVFAPGSTLGSSKNYVRFTYSRIDTNYIKEGIHRFAEAYRKCLKTLKKSSI